jgi:hypothetical protein
MPSATGPLPSDPAALRALAAALQEALVIRERELAARCAGLWGPRNPTRGPSSTPRRCTSRSCERRSR